MKIAILGYGRMGHMIEEVATQRGHQVVARIDKADAALLEDGFLREADVAIEFSTPGTSRGHRQYGLERTAREAQG